MLAGDIPDFIYCPSNNASGLAQRLIKDQALTDLTDLFEDGLKDRILDGFLETSLSQSYGDGKIYLAPLYYTAWSGGDYWKDEAVVTGVRRFVDQGGGFIGVGEPTACQFQGNYFQLSDVLGVERENGFSLSMDKYNELSPDASRHFILQDLKGDMDFGEGKSRIYAVGDDYEILNQDGEYSRMVVNQYGKGKSVYFAGLPYSPQNCRILQRAIYYAAGREEELYRYYVTDVDTEIAAYPESQCLAVINNAWESRNTDVYVDGKRYCQLVLEAGEMRLIAWREEKRE